MPRMWRVTAWLEGKTPLSLSTERPLDSPPLFVLDSNRLQSALPSKVERAHLALGSGGIDPLVAPFDAPKLDELMEESKIDLILATSKHNVQYLLGGYRYHFFIHQDAIGVSRYLPVVGFQRDRLDASFYIGNAFEWTQQEVSPPLWVGEIANCCWSSEAAAQMAVELIRRRGLDRATIGIEPQFIPSDAATIVARAFPSAAFVDATLVLEELRAVKRPDELAKVKEASDDTVRAMLTVMNSAAPGVSKEDLLQMLKFEEARLGLDFEYALISAGASFNRMPIAGGWNRGDLMSIDSGGNKDGYISDLTRMAVMAEPTSEMNELLAEVDAIQMGARRSIRAGVIGGGIYEAALAEQARCPHSEKIEFTAHGMGLTSNEAPRLTDTGLVSYPATHRDRMLAAGMVISIETQMLSPVGYLKLEDTVVVTDSGCEAYGDFARGWNRRGTEVISSLVSAH